MSANKNNETVIPPTPFSPLEFQSPRFKKKSRLEKKEDLARARRKALQWAERTLSPQMKYTKDENKEQTSVELDDKKKVILFEEDHSSCVKHGSNVCWIFGLLIMFLILFGSGFMAGCHASGMTGNEVLKKISKLVLSLGPSL